MSLWWLSAAGIVVGAVQVVFTLFHLRWVTHLAATQPSHGAQWSSVVKDLDSAIRAANSTRGRVAACDEATRVVEEWLNRAAGSRVRWRICASSGIAAGCAVISTPGGAAACFLWAVITACLTAWLGHRADSVAGRIQTKWNGLIRSYLRSFPNGSL